jgi:hypothetical protein
MLGQIGQKTPVSFGANIAYNYAVINVIAREKP